MEQQILECLEGRQSSYILPFFWQHGENHVRLAEELDAICGSGVQEFCVESRTHEKFCNDQWWEDFGFLLSEAKHRGMRVWLLDDKRFPSGYANGYIAQHPALRKRVLRMCYADVAGPKRDHALLADRKASDDEQLLEIVAYRRCSDGSGLCGAPVNLSENIQDDLVYLNLPAGDWRVCFVYLSHISPAGFEWYIDMLSKESCAAMIKAVYEPHYAHFSGYFGNTFAGFFSDEPCFSNASGSYDNRIGTDGMPIPWSDTVLQMMAQQGGMSVQQALELLPALWQPMDGKSAHMRCLYMDAVTRLYRENFSCQIGGWCRAHGVQYIGHVIEDMNAHMRLGYGSGHYFRALDGQDMAGLDVVLHQIVPGMQQMPYIYPMSGELADPEFFSFALAKLASSHAHIQPLKQGRVMCEIFGAYGWAEGLPLMKWLADHMLVRGVNHFVPHAFSPKAPDPDCPPHFWHGGKNPQYQQFGRLMTYMQRMCHALSGGRHISSVAVLYNPEGEWAGSGYMPFQKVAKALAQQQIDFDFVPMDVLTHAKTAVLQQKLCINQGFYHALVVSYCALLPYTMLEQLLRLAQAGLPVIFVDGLPDDSCEHREIAPMLPNFSCVPLDGLAAYVRGRGWDDIQTDSFCPSLRVYHIQRGQTDLVMLMNEDINRDVSTMLTLPFNGRCVIYDAWENRLFDAGVKDGKLSLHLPAGNSLLLVSDGFAAQPYPPYPDITRTGQVLELEFSISLQNAGELGYSPYQKATALFNITGKDGLTRFCGRIKYETVFTVSNAEAYQFLDLGEVGETAELFLNGVPCGVKICAPYRFDVAGKLRAGQNELVVVVASNLAYANRDFYSRFLTLPPSGMLGPVSIV